jgi:Xaa-Pro aminopeptidase
MMNAMMPEIAGTESRVHRLRSELVQQGLSGFIIPHADEYQNEYLPACAERLAWLTGFSGSAGTAVVLSCQAAVFVDGRYVLQVRNQVDLGIFEPQHISEVSVADWLSSVLKPGDKLAYDPWLHTPKEINKLRQACARVQAELIPCQANPVDAIWIDRPQLPCAPVVPHSILYAGQSSKEKRKELARKLKDDRIDVAVLTAPDSIAWLLNIRGGDVSHTPLPLGFACVRSDESAMLFLDSQKVCESLRDHLGPNVGVASLEEFGSTLEQIGRDGSRVLCDPRRTASSVFDQLEKAGAEVVEGEDPCVLPKACKNPVEIAGTREAHTRDGAAVCEFLAWLAREALQGTVTELNAQAYLDSCREKQTLWKDLSFPTISAGGPNGAIVHYRAMIETNRPLIPDIMYLVDSGGQYLDGTTDITRTVAIGTPTVEQRECYTRVLKGHIALAMATFPKGTTGTQLDTLARWPLWEAGLDYDHGTGHGVGSYLGVHEGPQRISKASSTVALEKGMIISNEPGFYKAGEFGIRLENLVLVVSANTISSQDREWLAFETLTVVPFDRNLIVPSLLTSKEIDWVNAYHDHVREIIAPLLNPITQSWLRDATTPLP